MDKELYYPCSENKGADQLRGICVFVFAYAVCWFSHEAAHFYLHKSCKYELKPLKHKFNRKVQVGNDQENAQSERNSHPKNRSGKNLIDN